MNPISVANTMSGVLPDKLSDKGYFNLFKKITGCNNIFDRKLYCFK